MVELIEPLQKIKKICYTSVIPPWSLNPWYYLRKLFKVFIVALQILCGQEFVKTFYSRQLFWLTRNHISKNVNIILICMIHDFKMSDLSN